MGGYVSAEGGDLEMDGADESFRDLGDADVEIEVELEREATEDRLESRWWFLTRVGMKGRSSAERKPEESKDSSSSSWNVGVVKYVAESARVPIG